MKRRSAGSRVWPWLPVVATFALTPAVARAQGGMTMGGTAGTSAPSMMSMMTGPLGLRDTRDGSGTSWLPDAGTPMGPMRLSGAWMLMGHARVFVQAIDVAGDRGRTQVGSVNWFMGMAARDWAGGRLTIRAMTSLEPLTVGRCGYPNLLQSGETCRGAALHDDQHPHDLFMEVAADYRRAIGDALAVEIYGGPAGEPALGPVAFPHRPSADGAPLAPISHHWLDSTHVSFGVVTGAVYGRHWKLEASAFNGREPDDRRYGFDLARLDSTSGRVTAMIGHGLVVQASAGRLRDAEMAADGHRTTVDRVTASSIYHRAMPGGWWTTTAAWGRNREGETSTHATLVETHLDLTGRDGLFGRFESVGKTAEELALPLPDGQVFSVRKIEMGYTRAIASAGPWRIGAGGTAGLGRVPAALAPFYGGRGPFEFSAFLTLRTR